MLSTIQEINHLDLASIDQIETDNDTVPIYKDSASVDHLGESVDQLIDVENVVGSKYSDLIIGNDANNVIETGGGSDTLVGGDGQNTFKITDSESFSQVIISDFDQTKDTLDLTSFDDVFHNGQLHITYLGPTPLFDYMIAKKLFAENTLLTRIDGVIKINEKEVTARYGLTEGGSEHQLVTTTDAYGRWAYLEKIQIINQLAITMYYLVALALSKTSYLKIFMGMMFFMALKEMIPSIFSAEMMLFMAAMAMILSKKNPMVAIPLVAMAMIVFTEWMLGLV